MVHWAWLIAAFFGGSIITAVIITLLNLSAMREWEQEYLQRLMEQYPLPERPGENHEQAGDISQKTKSETPPK